MSQVTGTHFQVSVLLILHQMAENRLVSSKNASSHDSITSWDVTPCSLVDKVTASHNRYFPNTRRLESQNKWSQSVHITDKGNGRSMSHLERALDLGTSGFPSRCISDVFWNFMQRKMVVSYRRFVTTYRSHLQGQTRPTGSPETSVTDYHSTLCKAPEERRYYLELLSGLYKHKSQRISTKH